MTLPRFHSERGDLWQTYSLEQSFEDQSFDLSWPIGVLSDVGCRMSDILSRMSDVGCRMSDILAMSDAGWHLSASVPFMTVVLLVIALSSACARVSITIKHYVPWWRSWSTWHKKIPEGSMKGTSRSVIQLNSPKAPVKYVNFTFVDYYLETEAHSVLKSFLDFRPRPMNQLYRAISYQNNLPS